MTSFTKFSLSCFDLLFILFSDSKQLVVCLYISRLYRWPNLWRSLSVWPMCPFVVVPTNWFAERLSYEQLMPGLGLRWCKKLADVKQHSGTPALGSGKQRFGTQRHVGTVRPGPACFACLAAAAPAPAGGALTFGRVCRRSSHSCGLSCGASYRTLQG